MIKRTLFIATTLILLLSCIPSTHINLITPEGKNISERFNTPEGFIRKNYSINSFEYYLRTLPLKKHLSKVMLYNGTPKTNQSRLMKQLWI